MLSVNHSPGVLCPAQTSFKRREKQVNKMISGRKNLPPADLTPREVGSERTRRTKKEGGC